MSDEDSGEDKDENFLDHTFHDCKLRYLERRDNKTILTIQRDTHWYPGKPLTLLTLVNAENVKCLKEIIGGLKYKAISIEEAVIKRSSGKQEKYELIFNFHGGRECTLKCKNFWTERKEEYKGFPSNRYQMF